MTAIEQADALTAQAIELLLAERQRIDDRLAQLQGDKTTTLGKKRGRPAKNSQITLEAAHDQRASENV